MKRNYVTKLSMLLMITLSIAAVVGCSGADKETVATQNISRAVKQKESQVKNNIELGNKLVNSGKTEEAKKAYVKAIEGNVDKSNMNTVLSKIQGKLTKSKATTQYSQSKQSVNQSENANNAANVKPNQAKAPVPVPKQSIRTIGFVKNIYERDGKRYLTIDEAEFYMGERAVEEAVKDGKAYYDENNKPFVYDDYYIRNTDKTVKEYEISNDASFNLGKVLLNKYYTGNGADSEAVNYDTTKNIVNTNNNEANDRGIADFRENLYWITLNDNVVVQMNSQYTP